MKPFAMVSGLAAVAAFAREAAAQMTPPPATPTPPPGATGDNSGILMALALMGVMLLIVGVGVKLWDASRKRESDAVHLQSQLSDALLREADFFGLAITPTVHASRGSTRVDVTGRAPSEAVRDAALRIVRQECLRTRPDCEIVDLIEVVPEELRRTA